MVGREEGIHAHWHSGGGSGTHPELLKKDPARITSENSSLEGARAPQESHVSRDHTELWLRNWSTLGPLRVQKLTQYTQMYK